MRCAGLVFVVLALCVPVWSQESQEGVPQGTPYTFQKDVSLVLVDASVRNRKGGVISSLFKEDFRIFEDGAEQEVRYVSHDELPIALALVLDCSGSMRPELHELRNTAARVLEQLKPQDQVALFSFASQARRVVDLTTDRQRVGDEIESVHARGATNILDALHEAATYLKQAAPDKRRVVIVISDNVNTERGSFSQDEVIETAFEFETSIYDLRVNSIARFTMGGLVSRLIAPVSMSKIVEETGGEIMSAGKSLTDAFSEMIRGLRTRYTIGYKAPAAPDGKIHRLRVELLPKFGKPGEGYSVVYRHAYRRVPNASAQNSYDPGSPPELK